MTTQEVADRFVTLMREGQSAQIHEELYAPDIESIEPEGMPGAYVKGMEGIQEKARQWEAMIETMHSGTVGDPIVADNHFACTMHYRVTFKGAPGPTDMEQICLYTVDEGKITREMYYYKPTEEPATT